MSLDGPAIHRKFFCDFATDKFSGHINWPTPATMAGRLFYTGKQPELVGDDDYTFELASTGGNALTINRPAIHVELNGDETIDSVRHGWLGQVRRASHEERRCMFSSGGGPDCGAGGLEAVVSGLFGIDNVHGGYSELHPAYGLAIRVSRTTEKGEFVERWSLLARNWGNEGWCSRAQHELPGNTLALRVPLPHHQSVTVTAVDFKANHPDVRGPNITRDVEGLLVRFVLPDASSRPLVSGDLALRWRISGLASLPAVGSTPRAPVEVRREPGSLLRHRLESLLTEGERNAVRPQTMGAAPSVVPKRSFEDVKDEPPPTAPPPLPRVAMREDAGLVWLRKQQADALCGAARRLSKDPAPLDDATRGELAVLLEACPAEKRR